MPGAIRRRPFEKGNESQKAIPAADAPGSCHGIRRSARTGYIKSDTRAAARQPPSIRGSQPNELIREALRQAPLSELKGLSRCNTTRKVSSRRRAPSQLHGW